MQCQRKISISIVLLLIKIRIHIRIYITPSRKVFTITKLVIKATFSLDQATLSQIVNGANWDMSVWRYTFCRIPIYQIYFCTKCYDMLRLITTNHKNFRHLLAKR